MNGGMVLLAVRPYKHAHFNLGRETFLVPVLWDSDGWLRIDTENGLVNTQERRPNLPYDTGKPEFYSDNFECTELSMIWNSIHPYPVHLFSLTERPGCLRLYLCPEKLEEVCTPAFLGRRQQHQIFICRLQWIFPHLPTTKTPALLLFRMIAFIIHSLYL